MRLGSSVIGKEQKPPIVHVPVSAKPNTNYEFIMYMCRAMTARGKSFDGKQSDITCAKCLGMTILRDGLKKEEWE